MARTAPKSTPDKSVISQVPEVADEIVLFDALELLSGYRQPTDEERNEKLIPEYTSYILARIKRLPGEVRQRLLERFYWQRFTRRAQAESAGITNEQRAAFLEYIKAQRLLSLEEVADGDF